MKLQLPEVLSIDERTSSGNPIRRISQASTIQSGTLAPYTNGALRAFVFSPDGGGPSVLVVTPKTRQIPDTFTHVVRATIDPAVDEQDLSEGNWFRHPLHSEGARSREQVIEEIQMSWRGSFSYVQEDLAKGISGLRGPQIGALHAIHAHWAVSREVATIVLPTGVGKTETMLSILITAQCERLMVVVPTDALRTQIANKFLSLGILKQEDLKVLQPYTERPIVCNLEHIPSSVEEVDELMQKAQVVVATSAIAGQCSKVVRERLAYRAPYLFIDEAHHAEAPTWRMFKAAFSSCRVVQFTATPFREDDRPLDGVFVFRYSLRQAQTDGYFKSIHFAPITDFDQASADQKIADKAVEILRRDFEKGHILMARVETKSRAKDVFAIYSRFPEFNPVELHTGISCKQQSNGRKQILSGKSRIVVCVDMLGEGFDLPALKIAAFHDIRKSLAVTLQLAGRFTRTRPDLGNATFIANDADVDVRDELRKLYTRDPDWNVLLPDMAEQVTGEQAALQKLVQGFPNFPAEIALNVVRPATSAVVYRTTCKEWYPEEFRKGIPQADACEQLHHSVNAEMNMLIVVAVRRVGLKWTDADNLFGWEWELYVVHWSPEQNLLYVNGSTNAGEYTALAKAVTRDRAVLIKGDDVFKAFHGIKRLQFHNIGTSEHLGRNLSYMGRMGSHVEPTMTEIQKGKARKSVLDGKGYEDGGHRTMGASRKGRLWSHQREDLVQFATWCKKVGTKLIDPTINPGEVLKGTLTTQILDQRPEKMPINVDWPEVIYTEPERNWCFTWGSKEYSVDEVSITLAQPSITTPIRFEVISESESVEFELEFLPNDDQNGFRFLLRNDSPAYIKHGPKALPHSLAAFFLQNPPKIWFADGSSLEGNEYVELKANQAPYDPAKLAIWDWTGIDLKKESQGLTKIANSVQGHAIQKLMQSNYDVIFDDDGSGEIADIVCIRITGEKGAPSGVDVELYHCKYAHGDRPGARIDDLYEVCGQAQKSIWWASSAEKKTDIFTHLMRRESKRIAKGQASRLERGTPALLKKIREISRLYPVTLSISVVQPGLSQKTISINQLQLLAVTENHLSEMYQLSFRAIASA